jgi:hypothetical protein
MGATIAAGRSPVHTFIALRLDAVRVFEEDAAT